MATARRDTKVPDAAEYVTIEQAAELVQMHEWTIRRLIDRGKLPASKPELERKMLRIKRQDLYDFMDQAR